MRQKKGTNFLLSVPFLVLDRNCRIFFTYIRPKESRSISYSSVYLISACVENSTGTATLNFLCVETDDYRLVFIVSISVLRRIDDDDDFIGMAANRLD